MWRAGCAGGSLLTLWGELPVLSSRCKAGTVTAAQHKVVLPFLRGLLKCSEISCQVDQDTNEELAQP